MRGVSVATTKILSICKIPKAVGQHMQARGLGGESQVAYGLDFAHPWSRHRKDKGPLQKTNRT